MLCGVRTFVNSGDEERTWPGIQRPDGSTLRLAAGETVELELPSDFEDGYLVPVKTTAKPKATSAVTTGSDQGAE